MLLAPLIGAITSCRESTSVPSYCTNPCILCFPSQDLLSPFSFQKPHRHIHTRTHPYSCMHTHILNLGPAYERIMIFLKSDSSAYSDPVLMLGQMKMSLCVSHLCGLQWYRVRPARAGLSAAPCTGCAPEPTVKQCKQSGPLFPC